MRRVPGRFLASDVGVESTGSIILRTHKMAWSRAWLGTCRERVVVGMLDCSTSKSSGLRGCLKYWSEEWGQAPTRA